ncbi:hypothetical protein DPMN_025567 [Dreissena polymorpha]|uniref:Uncharacterized protein n=2 Tax=Dreissena polymorpha TaxID=45954 RepID=A0A9D4LQ22_DREPO|nr:hypothetical protein DPMN_025567 [Dreissena polymorpha]
MNLQKLQTLRDGNKRVIQRYLDTLADAYTLSLMEFIATLDALEKKITQVSLLNEDILSKLDTEGIEEEILATDAYMLEIDIKLRRCARYEVRKRAASNLQVSLQCRDPNFRFTHQAPTPRNPSVRNMHN